MYDRYRISANAMEILDHWGLKYKQQISIHVRMINMVAREWRRGCKKPDNSFYQWKNSGLPLLSQNHDFCGVPLTDDE